MSLEDVFDPDLWNMDIKCMHSVKYIHPKKEPTDTFSQIHSYRCRQYKAKRQKDVDIKNRKTQKELDQKRIRSFSPFSHRNKGKYDSWQIGTIKRKGALQSQLTQLWNKKERRVAKYSYSRNYKPDFDYSKMLFNSPLHPYYPPKKKINAKDEIFMDPYPAENQLHSHINNAIEERIQTYKTESKSHNSHHYLLIVLYV